MRWKPANEVLKRYDPFARFTLYSESGYAVMQCVVDGVPIQRYIAFRVVPGSSTRQVIRSFPTLEGAQAACETVEAQSREIA